MHKFKKSKKWNENKEKIYLLGRVCGWIHDSIIDLCAIKGVHSPKDRSGRAWKKTVEFIEKEYGNNQPESYLAIIQNILKRYSEEIQNSLDKGKYDIRELVCFNSDISKETIDIQKEAKEDYNRYWRKNPTEVCRVCHAFNQETTPAVLFPRSDLGGATDVFYTDHMRRLDEFREKGGVCRWCLLWFLLLKSKTGNRLYKLCIYPHALFGRINWEDIFDPDQTVRIGKTRENFIYPHVAVIGLSGKKYGDFISQLVKNKILDKLYENGLRGKVFSTLVEPSLYLFDCGGIKISAKEYYLFKPILGNIDQGKDVNTYALAIKSMQSNKYSWGYLVKTKKLKGDLNMIKKLGEMTGLSFLKNIWVGGSPENRPSNAEKLIRRMNETLRKLKDKEKEDVVIDAMVAIGRKVALSTRDFRDFGEELRQKEVDALREIAKKLYEYREKSAQRTELVRAMVCYLGYVPYEIRGE